MKNKFIYLFCMILLILVSSVLSLEDVPIKTVINVKIDNNTNILRITGENFDWSKSLNVSNNSINGINQDIEILFVRKFGNLSEYDAMLSNCNSNFNFTDKWQKCMDSRLALELDCIQNRVNKTEYDFCMANLTSEKDQYEIDLVTIRNDKDNQIKTLTDERDTAQSHKSWLIIIAVGLGVGCVYLANKSGLFKRGETFKEREKPIDYRF